MIVQGLIVLINLRAVLSLVGIFFVVWFSWQWDRKWEQIGPECKTDNSDDGDDGADYKNMEDGEKPSVFQIDTTGKRMPPFNKMALVGWGLLAISHLFARWNWFGLDATYLNLLSAILLGIVGYVQAVMVPKSITNRQYTARKDFMNVIMVGGMVLVGILTYLQNSSVPLFPAILGSICIPIAPMMLWKARLVGDTFDSERRINPQPILFNFGGPILMFGWFWYWIGMNAMIYIQFGSFLPYLHIYMGFRLFFAMFGAVLIVAVHWFVGYALDEIENLSGEPDRPESLLAGPAFGAFGYFCGEIYEIKVFFILAWATMGLAMFFPYDWADIMDWAFLVAAVVMGYSLAMIEEEGLRPRNAEAVSNWTKRTSICLAVIAIVVPAQRGTHYLAVVLSVAGAAGLGYGQKFLLEDRKRGEKWLESNETEPPTVYSYGALLFPLCTIVLAWAVSMHPGF